MLSFKRCVLPVVVVMGDMVVMDNPTTIFVVLPWEHISVPVPISLAVLIWWYFLLSLSMIVGVMVKLEGGMPYHNPSFAPTPQLCTVAEEKMTKTRPWENWRICSSPHLNNVSLHFPPPWIGSHWIAQMMGNPLELNLSQQQPTTTDNGRKCPSPHLVVVVVQERLCKPRWVESKNEARQ